MSKLEIPLELLSTSDLVSFTSNLPSCIHEFSTCALLLGISSLAMVARRRLK